MSTTQSCPNCGTAHDIRVYVSGQRVNCRCGIRFEVRRNDVSGIRPAARRDGQSATDEAGVQVTLPPRRAEAVTEVPGGGQAGEGPVTPFGGSGVSPAMESSGGARATVRNGSAPGGPALAGVPREFVRAGHGWVAPRGGDPNMLRMNGVAGPGEASTHTAAPGESPGDDGPAGGSASSGVAGPSQAASSDDASGATVVRSPSGGTGKAPVNTGLRAEEEVETFVAGERPELPGFELMEVLGRGGMGEVWLARQQSLARTVAVKLLPPRLAKDPEFVTRFEKEATALAAVNHPNIVQIIDRGVAGEHYYFVMEYVEGRSLREAMARRGGLTPQQGLKILLQVARAIECAHEKDIIHRDLKPENILLDGRGHVKVADFGLAGIRQSDSRLQLTATAVAMGTLNYMAPEQRRDAKNVDARADLFSLGVMLYEVLTGELPLGRFKAPSARVPGLDPRLDTVVERLLETDPAGRYASATELCTVLEGMISTSSAPSLALNETRRVALPAKVARDLELARKLKAGWRRVRGGLSVVGGLAVLGFAVKGFLGPVSVRVENDKLVIGAQGEKGHGQEKWPPNTEADLFTAATLVEEPGGMVRLSLGFDAPGKQELNAHSGEWTLVDGELRARQAGKDASNLRLRPRTYVAGHWFSSDDFMAEVNMDVKPLGPEYSKEEDPQTFGELTFRITDVQVSVFAIPDAGMRLSWRYITEDGEEIVGNSAQDTDNMVADETPVPSGPFKVTLQMQRIKNAVKVTARLNDKPFARKVLPGFQGRVGKVALGCRNLACTFDELKVRGIPKEQPVRKGITSLSGAD